MNLIQNILLLIFSFISILGISQQQKHLFFDESWQISASKYSQYYDCECYTLKNGAFDGSFTCYNIKTDKKVKVYHFTNNVLDGEVTEYYDNGQMKLHAFYKNGQAIKEWKEWDEEGNLVVDKTFDEQSLITRDKKKQLSEYEKMYFGNKEFEEPVYSTKCILKKVEKERYSCSDSSLLFYYKNPPLPPSYFNDVKFSGKTFKVKLKYLLSSKGKVIEVKIIETSGDIFLDELAETHILNMIPFESAKKYENPIDYWIPADIFFKF